MEPSTIRFTLILTRPTVSGWDVIPAQAFAIVTYAVEPERVGRTSIPSVDLELFPPPTGSARAGFQPFLRGSGLLLWGAQRFRILLWPDELSLPCDRSKSEPSPHVWFFGCSLDSWSVLIAYLWKLPWHRG